MDSACRKIIIADDHAVVRTGMQLILDETQDLCIAEEARSGDELLEKLKSNQYDLVILDIGMPGKDTLYVLAEIRAQWEALPVVIFSMNPDEVYAVRMLKNGASAYINKETKPRQIIDILRTVLEGRKYFSTRQTELLADLVAPGNLAVLPHDILTDREFQVFSLLASGLAKSDIASRLSISKNTLSNHRNSIMKKMGFASNSDLTRYAIQHGIIQ